MPITRKLLIAAEGEIPVGGSRSFRYGVSNGIAYNDDGVIKAYVNACTHMGGTVQHQGLVFRCCRHFAEFDPATGERLSGQAPEGSRLTPITTVREEGKLFAILELKEDF